MKLDVTGIIVKEKDLSDSDKVITLLTREKGVITAIAKRSKTIRNRLGGMVQLFAYGTFTLFSARNGYLLDGCEIKEVFHCADDVFYTVCHTFCMFICANLSKNRDLYVSNH